MATLYVDYKNGVDTNDGSTGSPLKTLAHCLSAHAGVGDTIKLRGSFADKATWFREYNHTISLNNLIITKDTGHTPILVASHDYTSWAKTGGRTNVYESACTSGDFWKAWNTSTPLASAGSVAACDAAPNSYYFDDAGDKLYVNIGGAAPTSIEAYDVPNAYLATVTGTGVTLDGLNFYYQMMNLRLSGGTTTVQNCDFKYTIGYGVGPDFGWIKVLSAGNVIHACTFAGINGGTDTIYATTGSATLTISNCIINNGHTGIWIEAGTGHVVSNCLMYSMSEDGFNAQNTSAGTVSDCSAYNCGHGAFRLTDANTEWTLHHCTAYRSSGTMTYGFIADPDAKLNCYHCVAYSITTIAFLYHTEALSNAKNNIAMNSGTGYFFPNGHTPSGTKDYNCAFGNTNNYAESWSQGAHDVVADPSFVSAPTDFQLNVGSPCIDVGVAIAGINDGYVGVAPDIGRYEVAAAAPSSKQSSMIQRLLEIR
jgi:hypothetical protein